VEGFRVSRKLRAFLTALGADRDTLVVRIDYEFITRTWPAFPDNADAAEGATAQSANPPRG
jgi:hypothetical protein